MAKLKSQIIINAAMRLADQQVIPFYVLKKGDADSGNIFVEIEETATTSILYSRALNFDGIYEYRAISGDTPRPRYEIAEMIEREIDRDNDCWVVATSGQKGLQIFSEIA